MSKHSFDQCFHYQFSGVQHVITIFSSLRVWKLKTMSLKEFVFTVAKMTGLFNLASYWTSGRLPILCYHGFSLEDEHLFAPGLFMSAELFEKRMRWLKQAGYQTISLDEAVQRIRDGKLGRKDIVITIDDGFYGVTAIAVPILKDFGFTATIYVTTYYVVNSNPIFGILIRYFFWKTPCKSLVLNDLFSSMEDCTDIKGKLGPSVAEKIIEFGETQLNRQERMALARDLARRLEVDVDGIVSTRRFNLMHEAELADLVSQGFDIQLHTHRHRLPENDIEIKREIGDNRAILEPITKRPLNHLCYPSGIWSPASWPTLEAEGIKTSTTCEPGLISIKTPPYAWTRFLDYESTPQIVFEAEISGFSHLLRKTFAKCLIKGTGCNSTLKPRHPVSFSRQSLKKPNKKE